MRKKTNRMVVDGQFLTTKMIVSALDFVMSLAPYGYSRFQNTLKIHTGTAC